MKIGETLRFFRKNMKVTQKEMLVKSDQSVYSRIENDIQDIRFKELVSIFELLSVTPEEFINQSGINNEQNSFRELFHKCSKAPNDLKLRQKLHQYYMDLEGKYPKTLKELSNYIAIKAFFSDKWQEISPVSEEELQEIFVHLKTRKYFTQYDYILMSNTIFLFPETEIDELVACAFPLKGESKRDYLTKKFAYTLLINLISHKLYGRDFTHAQKYLTIAKEQYFSNNDYRYKMELKYLEHLYNYLTLGKRKYLEKIYDYIHFLEDIEECDHAQIIEEEVEDMIFNQKDYPITLLNLDV